MFNFFKRKIKLGDIYINKKTKQIYKANENTDLLAINENPQNVLLAKLNSGLFKELLFLTERTPEERKQERSKQIIDSLHGIKKHEEKKEEIPRELLEGAVFGIFSLVEILKDKLLNEKKAGS